MKRYIAALLIAVLCVPLLSVSVVADTMVMGDVVGDEYMPLGYIYPHVPMTRTSNQHELWYYDISRDVFLNIVFSGSVAINSHDINTLSFSNPNSLRIRAYPCNGRSVFTFTPEQRLTVSIPATSFTWSISTDTYTSGYMNWKEWDYEPGWPSLYNVTYSGDKISSIRPNSTVASTWTSHTEDQEIYLDSTTGGTIRGSLPAQTLELLYSEYAQSHFDYYVVQQQGSGITSTIDYHVSWTYSDHLAIGIYPVYGYLISAVVGTSQPPPGSHSSAIIRYDVGAYYNIWHFNDRFVLYGSEHLKVGPRLPLSVLNRWLHHFGYDSIYYSDQGAGMSNDLKGIGDQMGDWASQASGFQTESGKAMTNFSLMLQSYQPVLTGIWSMLPPWVYIMMVISLVIVIGRKVLGR